MTNCPNCNAPIEPYQCKCGYCGTYYFDFSGADLTSGKPCYVKIQDQIFLAQPYVETITSHPEFDTYCDVMGQMHNVLVRQDIKIRAQFDVLKIKEKNECE